MIIDSFISNHKLPSSFKTIVTEHFIPLANQIATHHNGAIVPYFVGINGCQGSGKSTLSEFLKVYIQDQYDLSVIVMSLDDFYYKQAVRANLASDVHPLFKTRGVPGTHDTNLAKSALKGLKNKTGDVTIPRFNKATDNPYPVEEWNQITSSVDIVIFEGWCWGVEAQTQSALQAPVNELENKQDQDGLWRHYVNNQLASNYQPLYDFMDMWVMFKAPSFDDVYTWRLEQEQKLAAKLKETNEQKNTKGVMSAAEILAFIQHYQRLTEHCLNTLPAKCDHVFELDSQRNIVAHIQNATKGKHE